MLKRDRNIPPDWKRVHLKGFPPKVTALSIPIYGVSWYRRHWTYWRGRAIVLALVATVAVVQILIYKSILVDDPYAQVFGAEWWGVAAFGALATFEGLWVAFVSRRFPFFGLRRRSPKIIAYPIDALLALNFLCMVFLAPGLFLAFTFDSLCPTPTPSASPATTSTPSSAPTSAWPASAEPGPGRPPPVGGGRHPNGGIVARIGLAKNPGCRGHQPQPGSCMHDVKGMSHVQ